MKNQILLYALVLITLFGGVPAVVAQESDEYAECALLLNSPPFNDMLTRNEGRDFGQLGARKQGAILLDHKCSSEVLNGYFESAGWEFLKSDSYEPKGPAGQIRYYTDSYVAYCRKSRKPINLFLLKCTRVARLYFLEGKISNLNVGATK